VIVKDASAVISAHVFVCKKQQYRRQACVTRRQSTRCCTHSELRTLWINQSSMTTP